MLYLRIKYDLKLIEAYIKNMKNDDEVSEKQEINHTIILRMAV